MIPPPTEPSDFVNSKRVSDIKFKYFEPSFVFKNHIACCHYRKDNWFQDQMIILNLKSTTLYVLTMSLQKVVSDNTKRNVSQQIKVYYYRHSRLNLKAR